MRSGERTLCRDEGASYEAFACAARAVAAAGPQQDYRVAIAARNLPEWPAVVFGCLLSGGVATLLDA